MKETKLKYTKYDIPKLLKEFEEYDGDGSDFVYYKADPIIEIPDASFEEWERNENINWKMVGRCTHCGRGANEEVMYHYYNGQAVSKQDSLLISMFDEGGSLNLYCIGSVCAKKITKEIIKPLGLNPRDYFWGDKYEQPYENDPEFIWVGYDSQSLINQS
jgi:hypothetical protein